MSPIKTLMFASVLALSVSAAALACEQCEDGAHHHGHEQADSVHAHDAAPAKAPAPPGAAVRPDAGAADEKAAAKVTTFKPVPAKAVKAAKAKAAAVVPVATAAPATAVDPVAAHAHAHAQVQVPQHDIHDAGWGYQGPRGPAFWGAIEPTNAACSQGLKQSPVNIAQFLKGDLPDIGFAYNDIPLAVVNTGHSAQVNVPPGSKATIDGKAFELISLDFHTPSEHYMDGSPYPMEAHLFHRGPKGEIAAIAVMIKLGAANATVDKIWSHIPASAGREGVGENGAVISAYDLLPASPGYYSYEGSLTAPPCTEGVNWLVMQQPIEISQEQLVAFQSAFPHNARPLQKLNERVVKGD